MSTIKIYSSAKQSISTDSWKLIASKLFKIDDIASYLANFTPISITKAQYIKQGLEIAVKIDATQANAQPNSNLGYKYVSIQNDNENIAYYYVRKTTWRSPNTIQLDLVMDVLNSFSEGSDYVFKANTRITREHKPRLVNFYFEITLTFKSEYDVGGSGLQEGETINLYYEGLYGDWTLIDEFEIRGLDSSKIILTPTDNSHIASDITEINNQVHYDIIFQIAKDNSNYLEAKFTEPVGYKWNCNRRIDYAQENINPLLICKNFRGKLLEDVAPLNQHWYLLYRNTNNPDPDDLTNPVEAYLVPENDVPVNTGIVDANDRIQAGQLRDGVYYYIKLASARSVTAIPEGFTFTKLAGSPFDVIEVHKTDASHFSVKRGTFTVLGDFTYWPPLLDNQEEIEFDSVPFPYIMSAKQIPTSQMKTSLFDNPLYWESGSSVSTSDNITDLDRTDPKNIKLIKLPYCPYKFEVSAGNLIYESTKFSFVSLIQADGTTLKCFKLDDLNTILKNSLTNSNINPFSDFTLNFNDAPALTDARVTSVNLESKLFNSEFYQPKLVYDSFVYNFELEKLNQNNYYEAFNNILILDFVMTRTINSKFLFRVTSLVLDKAESNYPDVLTIGRNNEEVLYNSPYISYIRTGFNYDVKAKNIANASQWIGVGASGLATVASLALPSVPLKIAGVVGSLVSMAMSVKNAVVTTINNEQSLKQKILQEQNRTVSVSGCDDVDLMSEYTGNRLKYMIYEPNDVMKSMLQDLFFYAGYASNRMGLPNHNTRVNFDYLECDAELESAGANVPQEILDELKNCFKVGVTYIHKTNRPSKKWDIAQEFENWEIELFTEE